MIELIKKAIGPISKQDKIDEYLKLEKELELNKAEIDQLAERYNRFNKEYQNGLEQNGEDEIIKSKLQKRHDTFLSEYLIDLGKVKKKKEKIDKMMGRLIKGESDIISEIKEERREQAFMNIKGMYKGGKISASKYNQICKAMNSGVTMYSDVLVFNNKGELLLLKRNENASYEPGVYCLPGGHVDPGESHEQAGYRELMEETYLTPGDLDHIGELKNKDVHICYYRCDLFDNVYDAGDPVITLQHDEHTDFEWVNPFELRDYKMIKDSQNVVFDILYPHHKEVVKITKSFLTGEVNEDIYLRTLEKAGYKDKIEAIKKMKDPDNISGGVADGKTIKDVMDKYNLSEDDVKKICEEGTKHEMEHTDDENIAREIARDHIWEDKDYYKKLKKIEKSDNNSNPIENTVKESLKVLVVCHNQGVIPQSVLEKAIQNADEILKSNDWTIEELEDQMEKEGLFEKAITIQEDDIIEQDSVYDEFDLYKALDTTKLVSKKVNIQRKDGTSYMAIRWVNPDTGESYKFYGTPPDQVESVEQLQQLIDSDMPNVKKYKMMIDAGIYNKHMLARLINTTPSNAYQYLKQSDFTGDQIKKFSAENMGSGIVPPAEINEETGEIETDPDLASQIEQEIQALIEADGLNFDDSDLHKINPQTGKDVVDTVMDKFVDMVAKKEAKLAMFYGTGGVGKTYGVKQVLTNPETINGDTGEPFGNKLVEYEAELQPNEDQYDFIKITGKVSPSKLYKTLYEHNGKLLMIDDADAVLEDGTAIDMLKGATDTTLEEISWDGQPIKLTDGSGNVPIRFKFTGGVVIISNLSEKKLREYAQPLLESRVLSLDVSRTMEETIDKLDRIKDKMPFEDRDGNPIEVSQKHKDVAIEFIKKYKNHMPVVQVNGRTLGKLALIHKRESRNYKTDVDFYKSYAARSLMNVKDHQIKAFHKNRLLDEVKQRKQQKLLVDSINNKM
jgi:8-oxo-dGTP pyrophosphatase MutT (NUDIX family)